MTYYSARYEQEMKYQSIQLPNLDQLQEKNQHKTDASDQQIISAFLSLKKLQDQKMKKGLNLAKILKDIILKNLQKSQEAYHEIVFRLSQNLQETKSKLTKLETLISTNNKSFQQTFDSLDSHEIKTDFLTEAQTLLRNNLYHSELQRTLAMETFNFWQEVDHLESQRQLSYKNQLHVTLQAEQDIGNTDLSYKSLLDELMVKMPESLEDEKSLSKGLRIQDVFSVKQLVSIAQLFKALPENYEQWTFQMIKREFENFDVSQQISIDKRLLTLKKFKCQQLVEQGANHFLVECRLFITVDLFFIAFNYSCDYFLTKPNFCVNMRNCKLQLWDHLSIEIKEIQPGFFLNKEIPYLMKFKDSDQVEELIKFVETINFK